MTVEFNPFYKGPPRSRANKASKSGAASRANPQRVGKDPLDRYYTPAWAVDALADDYPFPRHVKTIWEPCAGRGDIVSALKANQNLMQTPFEFLLSDVELSEDVLQFDFLKNELRTSYGRNTDQRAVAKAALDAMGGMAIITNPPYSIPGATAADFVRRALDYTPYVAMLLRMNWVEKCEDRADIFENRPPYEIRAISPRVPFEGPAMNGKKQAPNGISAWFIWKQELDYIDTKFTWVDGKP